MRGVQPVAHDVFAPSADAFFHRSDDSPTASSATPPRATALEQVGSLVPTVLGLYEAIIDEQAITDEAGAAHAAAQAWADDLGDLAATLRAANAPASTVRRVAGARLLTDLVDDIIRVARLAGITPEEVIDHLTGADDPVAYMPFLAQMRQMLFARLRNTQQICESNDLVDIMFLCCAAGYADVVVGERRTIGYLRQARQPRPRARLATSLQEALRVVTEITEEEEKPGTRPGSLTYISG